MKIFPHRLLFYLWVLTLALFSQSGLSSTLTTPLGPDVAADTPVQKMQQMLDQGIKLAGSSPGREKTVYAQALKLRQALAQNDFEQANAMLQQSLSHSGFHAGQFQPFSALLRLAAKPGGENLATHLDAWVKADPHNAMPYLLRSVYLDQKGWRIRGTRFANDVLPQHMQEFHRELRLAMADAKQALRLAPDNPYANYLPLWIASGIGMSPAMQQDFAGARKRFPQYYALYSVMLSRLAPKWSGSVVAMLSFVHRYAASKPDNSELSLLYLQLFANLLDDAEIRCTRHNGTTSESCVAQHTQNLIHAKLLQRVDGVLQIYPQVRDKLSYSRILGRILNDISEQGGSVAQHYADQFIQRAAAAMGTNTQLSAENTSQNNFVMDRLTGDIWYRQSHYRNAEKLYRRAVADLGHTDFPSPAQMEAERAKLFQRLANLYYQRKDYQNSAIYQIAAGYMRGGSGLSGYSPTFCGALYHLGLYKQSIGACRAQVQAGAGDEAIYWLALAHEALHQIPRAQARYRQLAGSESSYRAYSAIQLSVIHAEHHQFQKMLNTLNAYPWLYHQSTDSSRFDIAAAYNNRCYAELHLGHLHAALQDCQASLRYGNLPDAYAKEQEILQRLHMTGAAVQAHDNGATEAWSATHWGFWVAAILFSLLTEAISLAASYGLVKWTILRSRLYHEQDSPHQSVFAQIRRWYVIYFIVINGLGILRAMLTIGILSGSVPRLMAFAVELGPDAVGDLIIIFVLPLALSQILLQQNLVRTFWGALRLFLLGAFSYFVVAVVLIFSSAWAMHVTGLPAVIAPEGVWSELIAPLIVVLPGWL
ncbi:hypothetical protein [Acidithiobacillus thiooxidans]|uniref:hypothetical protein n=1 Tax=Acidithiobacillus thiooxidans TaxID=930 RepID=UPI0035619534|nr:hypothetical protein [Acidithiobacillus sp.]